MADGYSELPKRQLYLQRWGELKNERASWEPNWRQCNELFLPETARFISTDRNDGRRRDNQILDSQGTYAVGVLAAGMMAGMTSPARPWFRVATADDDLNESQPVKVWLAEVGTRLQDIFARTNTYRALHSMYAELAVYGTSADIVVPNFENVLHHFPLTIGQYALANNAMNEVDTLYREFDMTVYQMVGEFVRQPDGTMDWSRVSPTVKNLWDRGSYHNAWLTVMHVIEPRTDRNTSYRDNKSMPFSSCYFETGWNGNVFARESGFVRFPALCPRWETVAQDVYGRSPARMTLGDNKELQHSQFRKAQGIDYQVKPPVQVPVSMKNMDINTLPGGASYYDGAQTGGIKPLWQTNIDLRNLMESIGDVRSRINRNFYVDLFLMLAQDDRSNITAREIAERHEEKMLMLGPVLERLQDEMLKPLIDIGFDRLIEANLLPPPPPDLANQELNIQFVSVLAQAQRAVGTSSIDRLIGTVGSMAQLGKVDALDKLNSDEIVDRYADQLGIDPQLIVANDKVALIREQRAKAQAAQAQAEQAPAMAKAAKDASEADLGGNNVLSALTGYT